MHTDAPTSKALPPGSWLSKRPLAVDFGGPADRPFQPFAAEWMDQPVIQRFRAVADRFGGKLAVDDGTERLTYAELRARVDALGAELVARTPPHGLVVAMLDNTAAFPVAFLACLMTGRPILPVDISYPRERQEAIMAGSGAAAIILGSGLDMPAQLKALPCLKVPLNGADVPAPDVAADLDAPAGIIYTSGSTGRPKGVAFSQRQFLSMLAEYVNACHIGADDTLAGLASLSGGSAREALAALLTGATFQICDLRQNGISAALRALRSADVTILAFVPSVLRSIAGLPEAPAALANLRAVDLFGEPVTAETVAALREVLPPDCHVRVSLGSTETMVLFHWFVPPDFPAGRPLPCGYLASRMAVAVLDEEGRPVPPGEAGELVARGRHIASGLWQEGAVLPGAFRQDPDDPQARIFSTGDIVRIGADGLAEFLGRRDRRVKIRGLRADPADVEAALHRLPGVVDCAVVARGEGEELAFVAYVVPLGHALTAASLRDALRPDVPAHMIPAEIHLIGRLPRLPNFKADLAALTRGTGAATDAA